MKCFILSSIKKVSYFKIKKNPISFFVVIVSRNMLNNQFGPFMQATIVCFFIQ